MSEKLTKKSVARNYTFLAIMLGSMILGSVVGCVLPSGEGRGRQRPQVRRHRSEALGHPVHQHDVLHRGADGVCLHCRLHRHHAQPQAGRQDHGHHHSDLHRHRRHRRRHHDRADEDHSARAGPLERPGRRRGGRSHLHPGPDRELLHRGRLLRPAQPQRHAASDRVLHPVRLRREPGPRPRQPRSPIC